jgi:polysaccharide chain length determinant protein (PEP-CTERM system associated)
MTPNPPLDQIIRPLLGDIVRHRRAVVVGFVAVSLGAVLLGLVWPKVYTASVTVYMDGKSVIQPLMQGAAVTTEVVDRSMVAREILTGRLFMSEVMETAGMVTPDMTEAQKELLGEDLKKRTAVTNIGQNLIKIEYRDADPQRAYKVVKKFGDLFISDAIKSQSNEADAAFKFIDTQVQEYFTKVVEFEKRLKDLHGSESGGVATLNEITARSKALQDLAEKTTLELKEAENKKSYLERQLAGESAVSVSVLRESQYMGRIAELEADLEKLRLDFHDSHPDVGRVRGQISELRDIVTEERRRRELAASSGRQADDLPSQVNPIYQKLRGEIIEITGNIETLQTRLTEVRHRMREDQGQISRINSNQGVIDEVRRDYEVNRDIYQDLLKRRESARVSRRLDQDKKDLTFRIAEPPVVPRTPSGVRFLHFALGGLILGVLVPTGALLGLQQLDQRIRSGTTIQQQMGLPLLAVIPHMPAADEQGTAAIEWRGLRRMVLATLAVISVVSAIKAIWVSAT